MLDMGPLQQFVDDPSIQDIAINGPEEVLIRRKDGWSPVDVRFPGPDALLAFANGMIAETGHAASHACPIVETYLPGGIYISIVTQPVCPWPSILMRVQRD